MSAMSIPRAKKVTARRRAVSARPAPGRALATDEVAALDEERELARRKLDDDTLAPQAREATLEALLEDAEAGAVPDQHLARVAAVDEEEEIAAERIASEPAPALS